jgi:hypothetical protein
MNLNNLGNTSAADIDVFKVVANSCPLGGCRPPRRRVIQKRKLVACSAVQCSLQEVACENTAEKLGIEGISSLGMQRNSWKSLQAEGHVCLF